MFFVGKKPTVMLLDGDYLHTLQIAAELKQDLDIRILGIGSKKTSAIFRSRYCDIQDKAIYNNIDEYAEALIKLIRKHHPDIVVPVGYRSVMALDRIRDEVYCDTKMCLPPTRSLDIALNKKKTLNVAEQIGIGVPFDFSEKLLGCEDSDIISTFPYPVFLKASREAGKNITSIVKSKEEFWTKYKELKNESGGDDILVQEFIDGDNHTYGCGVLFLKGEPIEVYCHEELISVPRSGGSGTKVRLYENEELKRMSIALLSELNWNGIALVEFKKRKDGSLVLMEINPKFWASYSLASKNGYHFASLMVSGVLNIPYTRGHIRKKGIMIFPIREFSYVVKNRENESLIKSMLSMLWPPPKIDVNIRDLKAWIPDKLLHSKSKDD